MKYLLFISIIIIFISIIFPIIQTILLTGNGYAAKITCTIKFGSNRNINSVIDLYDHELLGIFKIFDVKIHNNNNMVSSSLYGFSTRYAYYRKNLGCVLAAPNGYYYNEIISFDDSNNIKQEEEKEWPYGNKINQQLVNESKKKVNMNIIKDIMQNEFIDHDKNLSLKNKKNTRAIIIVYKGQIISEQYANGFNKNTKLVGWSMTKSLINALIGRLAQLKLVTLDQKLNHTLWRNDIRKDITILNALHMSTGLEFDENYHPFIPKDPSIMLFASDGTVNYAAKKSLQHKIGSYWSYSSGTSNLLSHFIRQQFNTYEEYIKYTRQFFNDINASSFVMETDASGDFVGSSFSYATARDWTRFGLLFLNNGIWGKKQILPKNWSKLTSTLAPNANNQYGMHWWLGGTNTRFKAMPNDAYLAHGYEGQSVVVIPSYDMVVVRLGCTKTKGNAKIDELVAKIITAIQ